MNPYPTLSGETLVVPILGDPIAQVKSPDGVTRALRRPWLQRRRRPDAGAARPTSTRSFAASARCVQRRRADRDRAAQVRARRALRHPHRPRRLPRLGQRRPAQPRPHLARRPGRRRRVRRRLRAAGGVLEGARALQVGAGGAGSAIALALLEAGVAELTLHDADPARRDALTGRLRDRFGDRVTTGPAESRPGTGSSPTRPRWACARATRARWTSPASSPTRSSAT